MSRNLMFLIFITVASLIVGGIHYYIYRRLVVTPALPAPWNTTVSLALLVLAISIPLSFVVTRFFHGTAAKIFLLPVYVWLGAMFMTFSVLLTFDVVKGIAWLGAHLAGHSFDPERRLFLSRLLSGTAVATVAVATGVAIRNGYRRFIIKRLDVTLSKLPPELDGFTIAQITDLHLSPTLGRDWLTEVVAQTNALQPDLIAITGDLADGTVAQLGRDVEPLADLRAPHGVFFVTGNHEYFFDLDGWLQRLGEFGIRVLRNERVTIERNDVAFDLAGVDDNDGSHLAPGHGTDVAAAMTGRDASRAAVLLAHQPRTVAEAAKHGVDLVLAGHTHGGQIWPFKYLVYLQQPYINGLHNHNGTQIYVSEGTGFWGPPMRLGTAAEISLITLRAPVKSAS